MGNFLAGVLLTLILPIWIVWSLDDHVSLSLKEFECTKSIMESVEMRRGYQKVMAQIPLCQQYTVKTTK